MSALAAPELRQAEVRHDSPAAGPLVRAILVVAVGRWLEQRILARQDVTVV